MQNLISPPEIKKATGPHLLYKEDDQAFVA